MQSRMRGAVGTGRENLPVTRLVGTRTDRPKPRLIHRLLSVFGLADRPSLLPSPTVFWALSPSPSKLKPLPQPTIFWAVSASQILEKRV